MAIQFGHRTRDAVGAITLDTTVTPIRSLKMFTVTGSGGYNQYFAIPDIKASSFVVVDSLLDASAGRWSAQAFWSDGQLHLRGAGTRTWQVMILSTGSEPFSAQGTYGIRAKNNGLLTQIDPVNRLLSIRYRGSFEFGVYWRPGIQAQITGGYYYQFPAPITTYERPLVFLNSDNHMMCMGFYVTGSPGNWTGWGIDHNGLYFRQQGMEVSDYMRMKWFLASYQANAEPAGDYGEVIRGAVGERLFASPDNLALLNSQPANNSFFMDGEDIQEGAAFQASSRMPWTGDSRDYVLANALFSHTNIEQTANPIIVNWGGFLVNNRSILKMYAQNWAGNPSTGVSANGRTLFASRPMKPI